MDVSINYPWGTHSYTESRGTTTTKVGADVYLASPGWDFGGPPAGWGIQVPRRLISFNTGGVVTVGQELGPYWKRHLPDDLRFFHRIGLKAVRFALLFNGLMYGVNQDIPHLDSNSSTEPWQFRPVPLSEGFLADFRELVWTFGEFSDRGVPRLRLMPVVFGFEFVQDPYRENREQRQNCQVLRAQHQACDMPRELIRDPERPRDNGFADFYAPPNPPGRVRYSAGRRSMALSRAHRDGRGVTYGTLFLVEVLERLLQEFAQNHPLQRYHNVIHSWDLCGEPEGFTASPGVRASWPHVVSNTDMLVYLTDGINLVNRYGFEATIGFRDMNTVADWRWQLPPYLGQFHTYDGEPLPRVLPGESVVIGEAATTEVITAGSQFDDRFRFQARPSVVPTRIPLQDRLEWFEDRGYREVFLWSAGRAAPDNRHRWTRHEHDQIERFTGGLRPGAAQRLRRFVRVP